MGVNISWKAWYGDQQERWEFPDGWQVQLCSMVDASAVDEDAVLGAIRSPIGAPPLMELARKAKSAVIVVEDVTRPAPTAQVLPAILSELKQGGLTSADIRILIGLGGHPPMTRSLIVQKLGIKVVETYEVFQHHPYRNVTHIGNTSFGTPVYINDLFLEADLRLAVGSITPHGMMSFGGGAKTVSVGVAGIETIASNHNRAWAVMTVGVPTIETNEWRQDLEEIAQLAKLDFVVHSIVNSQRELAAVFAGHPRDAHREGVKAARKIYRTQLPSPTDIVILNAYPKDTDLIQSINAMNAIGQDTHRVLKKDGTLVIASACSDGAGVHYLVGAGVGQSEPYKKDKKFSGREVIIYSPNLSHPEVMGQYPPSTLVFNTYQELIAELERRHGARASAAVFPCASIQIPPGW